jgi:phosphate starvation-inducible PhoH-like protein
VIEVLKDVPGISFTHFQPKDVVRHPLVQRIVEAYERFEARQAQPEAPPRCLSLICNWPPKRRPG